MKNHSGAVIVAAGLVVAALIYVWGTRYQSVSGGGFCYVYDRFTGRTQLASP